MTDTTEDKRAKISPNSGASVQTYTEHARAVGAGIDHRLLAAAALDDIAYHLSRLVSRRKLPTVDELMASGELDFGDD